MSHSLTCWNKLDNLWSYCFLQEGADTFFASPNGLVVILEVNFWKLLVGFNSCIAIGSLQYSHSNWVCSLECYYSSKTKDSQGYLHSTHCSLVMPYDIRSWSAFSHTIPHCLMAPSHYLNQCLFIIIKWGPAAFTSGPFAMITPYISQNLVSKWHIWNHCDMCQGTMS